MARGVGATRGWSRRGAEAAWNGRSRGRAGVVLLAVAAALAAPHASATSDEIQVYTDDIAKRGEPGLELHMNYAPIARKTPEYRGEQPPYRIFRLTPEISTGLAERWDVGLYLPFSASGVTGSSFFDRPKVRLKYLVDHERDGGSVFYGANLEIANTTLRTSPARWRAEMRFIAGFTTPDWLVAVNPIFSSALSRPTEDAESASGVDFDLAVKVARRVVEGWSLGIEHYSEAGSARRPHFGRVSGEQTFLAADFSRGRWELNVGVGHGWTESSDKLVFKAIVGTAF